MANPVGRPTKYDPAINYGPVIYGLHDGCGNVFYVGKSSRIRRRIADYASGNFHGNKRLEQMVDLHGVNVIILNENPSDINSAEFDEIESREGLVNVILERNLSFLSLPSKKTWHVKGVQCPSAQYIRIMRTRFGKPMDEFKSQIVAMNDDDRLRAEIELATRLYDKVPGIRKWMDGYA